MAAILKHFMKKDLDTVVFKPDKITPAREISGYGRTLFLTSPAQMLSENPLGQSRQVAVRPIKIPPFPKSILKK